jgi:hypothetical protein
MILPGEMAVKDCFFDPIPQIIHDTESSRLLLLFSFLFYHSIYLEKQFEDSSEAFVDMEFELFGARKLHCRISFQLSIFRQYNFNSKRYRPTTFSARVKDEIRIPNQDAWANLEQRRASKFFTAHFLHYCPVTRTLFAGWHGFDLLNGILIQKDVPFPYSDSTLIEPPCS